MMRLSARATASFVGRSSVTSAVSRATRPTPSFRDSRPGRHRAGSRQLAALSSPASVALAALLAAGCTGSSNTLTVAGTVEIREVRLSPLASGRLFRLLKDEGDSVHVGDTVAVLEQPGLSALIEQRRALADAATTRTAEIRAAEADSQRSANDLGRARVLAGQGIASAQELERLQSAAAAAAARLQAVRASVRESQAARAGAEVTESIRDQLVRSEERRV